MEHDFAFLTIQVPISQTVLYQRDISLSITDKIGQLGKLKILITVNVKAMSLIVISGGTIGLFTGMSILSMVEVCFWIYKIITGAFKTKNS